MSELASEQHRGRTAGQIRGVVALGVGWGDGESTGGDDGQHGGGASLLPHVVSAGNQAPAADSSP
ncbi:MAG: hypothetical protein ACRDWT_08905, partial [Jatrophihabitantaceae bacterium]